MSTFASRRWIVPLVVAAVAAAAVAGTGGALTELGPWYRSLARPSIQPPDWLFGPAWTLIFALAAVSAATAWRRAPDAERRTLVVALFAVNAAFNILWSLLFFHLQRPDWALVEVAFLWGSIVALIIVLRPISRAAAWLLAPYLAWVTFAAVLNWRIVALNGPF
jgi:benzodiazapine receptor